MAVAVPELKEPEKGERLANSTDRSGSGLNINSGPVFSASGAPTLPPLCLRSQPHITLAPNTCAFIHTQGEKPRFGGSRTFETVNIFEAW